MPPLGLAPRAVVPPIQVGGTQASFRPVAPAKPRAESYDEIEYACRAGDSYESISKAKYGTDAYAAALRLYNRNHFQASDGIKRDGQVVPGEKIFLPPISLLEQRHGDLIRKSAPVPSGPPAGGAPLPPLRP